MSGYQDLRGHFQFSAEGPVMGVGSMAQAAVLAFVLALRSRANILVAYGIRPRRIMATHSGSIFIQAMLYAMRLAALGRPRERRKMELYVLNSR